MGGTGVLHDLIMNSLQTETADVITKRVLIMKLAASRTRSTQFYSDSDTSPSNETRVVSKG